MTEDQRDITIDRLRTEIVRQHDRIRELEEERDKLRTDRDRLSAELQRVVEDEHLDEPPLSLQDYEEMIDQLSGVHDASRGVAGG